MLRTITTTWGEIKKNIGRDGVEFIQIRLLGKYGFDDSIVEAMIKFEIFPTAYHVCGADYVIRDEIFGSVVHRLLKNSMDIYQAVEDRDAAAAAIKAAMEDVVLDEEAVAKLASGEWGMDQVRERSQTILAERAASQPSEPETTEATA